MNSEAFSRVLTVAVGVLLAGEACALLVGMYVLSPRPNPWISPLNTLWIGLDILCGAALIGLGFVGAGAPRSPMLLALASVASLTHLYRAWEFFQRGDQTRFLVNPPLFVVNAVKLLGLVTIGIVAAASLAGRR